MLTHAMNKGGTYQPIAPQCPKCLGCNLNRIVDSQGCHIACLDCRTRSNLIDGKFVAEPDPETAK